MKRLSRTIYTPTNLNTKLLHRLSKDDNSLVRIVFSSRNLGSEGVDILTRALEGNTHLSALDLSHNSIGPKGAYFIASLLEKQTKTSMNTSSRGGIRTLILADNNLRDDGVTAIANALENNITLEHLWIDDNFIGASGFAKLADALQRNTNLKILHIRHNSFQSLSPLITSIFDKRSLDSVVDSNHTLQHAFLSCGYDYECDELEMLMKINRMGRKEARMTKIAMFLEENLASLLKTRFDTKLLPRLLGILAQHGNISTVFRLMQNLPSEVLLFQCTKNDIDLSADDAMDIEYL